MFKVIDIQETPNPDALKFVLDGKLLESGVRQFDTPEAAYTDPLAASLFAMGGVESVFYMGEFVTVTKFPNRDWRDLQPKAIKMIESNATPAQPQAPLPTNGQKAGVETGTNAELLLKINQVLEDNVIPALAGDGGGLEVMDFHDYVLTVHYQGACGTCPSSTAGTLTAVQNLLQRMVDPRIQVIPG